MKAKPTILFLCTACPFGTNGAGVRTLHIARLLEKLGPVTMVAVAHNWTEEQIARTRSEFNLAAYIVYDDSPVRGFKERWRQIFDPRYLNSNGIIAPASAREQVQALVARHDVTWVHTLKVANTLRQFHWPRTVMDVDDIPSRYHRLAAGQTRSPLGKLKRFRSWFAEHRRESLSLQRFSVLTVCKESDRRHFNNDSRVHVVPNGFAPPDTIPIPKRDPARPLLGMIGDFQHLPNSTGLHWFIKSVWPEIRARVPTATLRLVGKHSAEIAGAYQGQGIFGLGYVDDTGSEMASWSAMIVPTRIGGGSHLKVAEGLARKVPIVTTPHGARGYDVQHDRHVLVGDSAEEFAAGCVLLIQDLARGMELSRQGWELFEAKYSWNSIGPAVERTIEHCLSLGKDNLTNSDVI